MVDAALLSTLDGNGSPLWRPASLQDIYDLPDRTLRYFSAIRAGQSFAMERSRGGGKQGTIGGVKVG